MVAAQLLVFCFRYCHFSGSLYLLVLTDTPVLGAITLIGRTFDSWVDLTCRRTCPRG